MAHSNWSGTTGEMPLRYSSWSAVVTSLRDSPTRRSCSALAAAMPPRPGSPSNRIIRSLCGSIPDVSGTTGSVPPAEPARGPVSGSAFRSGRDRRRARLDVAGGARRWHARSARSGDEHRDRDHPGRTGPGGGRGHRRVVWVANRDARVDPATNWRVRIVRREDPERDRGRRREAVGDPRHHARGWWPPARGGKPGNGGRHPGTAGSRGG
jgi:hypothetical protein